MDFCQEMVEIERDEVLEAASRVIVGSGGGAGRRRSLS
jgi:hypothetical protein